MLPRAIPAGCLLAALALVLAPAAEAQQPRRGGVLRIADREAPNLDPHLSVSFLTHSWANMVYSQLVRYVHGPEQKHSADFTVVPDLAERWTTSPDGRVYVLSTCRRRPSTSPTRPR
jgi:ABC-type transport system substrate-binding protein